MIVLSEITQEIDEKPEEHHRLVGADHLLM